MPRPPKAGSNFPKAGSNFPKAGSNFPKAGSNFPKAGSNFPKAGSNFPKAGSNFDFTGGYGGPLWAFIPYRRPEMVWAQFLAWWAAKWPGRPLPSLHNLRALTGLSDERIREYLKD